MLQQEGRRKLQHRQLYMRLAPQRGYKELGVDFWHSCCGVSPGICRVSYATYDFLAAGKALVKGFPVCLGLMSQPLELVSDMYTSL